MRYCTHCSRMTPGEPHFCNFCGRSYDAKLCPRLHSNSREAQVCSECGSRDLTTPQPRFSLWLRCVLLLFSLFSGYVLLAGSALFFIAYARAVFTHPSRQFPFMLLALALGLIWLLYMEMPSRMRHELRRRIRKASK